MPRGLRRRSLRSARWPRNTYRRALNTLRNRSTSAAPNHSHGQRGSNCLTSRRAPIYGLHAASFPLEINSKSGLLGKIAMSLKNESCVCLLVLSAIALHAQVPATPGQVPATPAQTSAPKPPPSVVAGIPVNYDEEKVGTYTLADPLKLNDGKSVRDAKTWYSKRRPEIVEIFEKQQ